MKKIKVLVNNAKAFYGYHRGNIKISNLPTLLWIEPTNKCNLKCIMCPNTKIPENKLGFMSWEVYTKIIDEIREFASGIYLLISGESFLHKDIYKMIRYASDEGIRVLINTNATTLIQHGNVQKLLNSEPEHITFALDGYNAETYEKIRVGAKFDEVVMGIKDFLRTKKEQKKKKPYVAITTLLVGIENYKDKERAKHDFQALFQNLPVDEFIIKQCNTWGSIFKDTDKFVHQTPNREFYPCGHLWSTLSIHWDGSVVPCCFDFFFEYVLGNIKAKSLKEIWNDEPMLKLRKAMLSQSPEKINPLCDGCLITHLKPILGIPVGMRATVSDSILSILGSGFEKRFIKVVKKLTPSFSLEIDEKK